MNKSPPSLRALRDVMGRVMAEAFAQQGFAAAELVTRWADIVGAEVAAHAEPLKIQWPRQTSGRESEPGTLVLRVEGPHALEIQHMSGAILERVNRFFGWRAIGRLALRQAPLARRAPQRRRFTPDTAAAAKVAASLPDFADSDLRAALGRLGAAVKRTPP